jgi:hypothetical protein
MIPNNLETLKWGGPATVVENALVREIAEEIACIFIPGTYPRFCDSTDRTVADIRS